MKKFLEQTAEDFAGRNDLRNLCFVFPNRRSSIFFQRYLGKAAGRAVFSPVLKTIDELFADLSSLRPTDRIKALSVLYRCYSRLLSQRGLESESFDEFIFWGDILLSDFDDMDKYMVDVDRLLVNIKDLKDLSTGYDFLTDEQKEAIGIFCRNFRPEELRGDDRSDKKRMFSETWNLLQPLYHAFNEALASEGEGYEGMIYRQVAENPDLSSLERYGKIVFVGLNALNKCEIRLLDSIRDSGRGDFYWDFYGDMVRDKDNKSVKFIGGNVERYPSEHKHPVPPVPQQNISVVSVPSSVGQTRVASDILRNLVAEGRMADPVDTAIVLPDEKLLFPMLGDIPAEIDRVNVTMGYALSAGNVVGFFSILERLQISARIKDGEVCFYHRDVEDMLDHPYFLAAEDRKNTDAFKAGMRRNNTVFVPGSDLRSAGGDTWRLVFRRVEGTALIPGYQMELVDWFQQFLDGTEKEFLYRYRKAVERLSSPGIGLDLSSIRPKTYFRLLNRYVSLISVPYQGEPLDGVQIMGPLETRALDFRNIIMLSVSEGSFPSRNVSASFIPYNLRVGFDMPTYEFQDSIWAYHFYRSICRAENVWLIYDSRTEGLQSGEESRYVKQLKYHFNVPVKEYVASYSLGKSVQSGPPEVAKTPELMASVRERFLDGGEGSFSASSLNSYLACPLKWYYSEVKRLGAKDEVTEDMDAGLFGNIYHGTMERLYRNRSGELLSKEDLEAMRNDRSLVGKAVDAAFLEDAGLRPADITGRNLIFRNVVLKYVDRTLEVDEGSAPLVVTDVEKTIRVPFRIPQGTVMLKGRIDRIDRAGHGIARVVDYKTGSVEKRDDCSKVNAIFDRNSPGRHDIAFQLYFYLVLLDSDLCDATAVKPCIYALKEIFKVLPRQYVIDRKNLEEFKDMLGETISEIFDENVPFRATDKNPSGWDSPCGKCDFKRLCHRQTMVK